MIHIITSRATKRELAEMLDRWGNFVKLAVDVQMGILAGGGEWHTDCETVLLNEGSRQENIWGASRTPVSGFIDYDSVINLRPRQKHFSMQVQDPLVRDRIAEVIRDLLEGV